MIYILTGIAKSGKTLLCREIAKTYTLPLLSTDDVMMYVHFNKLDPTLDVNACDTEVAKKLEPFIYQKIKNMITNDETYVIEGVHFNTDFSRKLLYDFKHKIKIIYIGYKDISVENKTKEIFKYKDTMDNPWLFNHQGKKVEEIVEYMIGESKRVYHECVLNNLTYIDIYDINVQKQQIINSLFNMVITQ